MKKATLAFIAFLLLAAPGAIRAQFTYTTNANGTLTITGCTNPPASLVIPSNINGLTVTSIGQTAFVENGSITNVLIPSTVGSIGAAAFAGCPALTTVSIPNGVTNIGFTAFIQCSALINVTVPEGVAIIGGFAFSECGLTNITVPATVTNMFESFEYCTSLAAINVDSNNLYYSSVNGVLYSKDQGLLLQCPAALAGNITVPAGVTGILGGAFGGVNLTNIFFAGNAPFYNNPGSSGTAFDNPGVDAVYYLPGTTGWSTNYEGVPAIQIGASAVTDFTYETNAGAINVTGYNGAGGVVVIPTNINGLPVKSIGASAFDGVGTLTSVALPTNATIVGSSAFENCSNLVNVVLPDGLTTIGDSAFAGCVNLHNLTFPVSIASLGNNAFASCATLSSAYFYGSAPTAGTSVFANDPISTVFYLPCASGWATTFAGVPAAAETPPSDFVYEWVYTGYALDSYTGSCGALVIPSTLYNQPVTSLENLLDNPPPHFAFGATNITSVVIGSNVAVGSEAFESCPNLGSVILENGITNVGEFAFADCPLLTNVSVPASLTNTGFGAFALGDLTTLTIPPGSAATGYGEFYGNPLTNINLPQGLTIIGSDSFGQCANLYSITLPSSVTNIADAAFIQTGLTSVVIPAGVGYVGSQTFDACPLTNVLFLGNAPSIGLDAFFGDPATITAYYLPGRTGFPSVYGYNDVPYVLWNPIIVASGPDFGVKNGQFGFDITNGSTTNLPVSVLACTNLANPVWTPLTNFILTNTFYFSDSQWTNYPARHYGLGFP